VPAGEALALVGLGIAAFWSTRMLIWWAPVATGCFIVHAHAAWRRFRPQQGLPPESPRSRFWTVVAAGLASCSFATTPFGLRVFAGRVEELAQRVSSQTPVRATAWLAANPPVGQVFNTYEWGDYLVWSGPPDLPVFVTSQAHLVPRDVWRDYLAVISVAAGWAGILERYRVETIVLDELKRGALIEKLKKNDVWTVVFEDDIAVIFARRTNQ
jgi:hypothetical protein